MLKQTVYACEAFILISKEFLFGDGSGFRTVPTFQQAVPVSGRQAVSRAIR
jgi:hypothetical protein